MKTSPARCGLVALPLFAALAWAPAARAIVHAGDVAPAFTKSQLAGGNPYFAGAPLSLGDLSGKVVVFFLLGNT